MQLTMNFLQKIIVDSWGVYIVFNFYIEGIESINGFENFENFEDNESMLFSEDFEDIERVGSIEWFGSTKDRQGIENFERFGSMNFDGRLVMGKDFWMEHYNILRMEGPQVCKDYRLESHSILLIAYNLIGLASIMMLLLNF